MGSELQKKIIVVDLGYLDYKSAWELQRKVFDRRFNNKIADVLLLTEHNHVYTFGKSSDEDHLLASEVDLRLTNAEVFHVERGGDVTYHGPGQIVGYPILDLNNYYHDLHRYLRDLEEVLIRTLNDYGIRAAREEALTGVWVGNEKIAAIGVKVNRWVTMHGFALNVNTDLSYFDRIIPCGIFHKGVTSMKQLLKREVDVRGVEERLIGHFSDVFCVHFVMHSKQSFKLELEKNEWLQGVQP